MADILDVRELDDNVNEEEPDSCVRKRASHPSAISLASSFAKHSTHNLRRALDASIRRSIISVPSSDSEAAAKEEDAWLQAEYNVIMFALLIAMLAITVAVYFILEPFLHPLLWAVLAGNFLYPFKQSSTNRIREWLDGLEASCVPLSVGVIISPFSFFNYLSSSLDSLFDSYVWHLLFLGGSIISLYLTFQFSLLLYVYRLLEMLNTGFESVYLLISFAPLLQLMVLVVVQMIVLAISSRLFHPKPLLKIISVSLWFLILVNITSWCLGSMALPLVTFIFLLASLFYSKSPSTPRSLKKQTSIADVVSDSLKSLSSATVQEISHHQDEEVWQPDDDQPEVVSDSSYQDELAEKQSLVHFSEPLHQVSPTPQETPSSPALSSTKDDEVDGNRTPRRSKKKRHLSEFEEEISNTHRPSDQLFLLLYTCCMVVLLWRHPLFLLLLAPIVAWSILKRLSSKFQVTHRMVYLCKSTSQNILVWIDHHSSSLFPHPLPTLYNFFIEVDKRVLHFTQDLVGSIVSLCMISGMLIGCVGVAMLLVAQIQLELTNTVGLTVQVLNSSVADSPWLHSVVDGKNNSLKATMEQFTEKGFHSSREWLATHLQDMIGKEHSGIVIEQVLQTYDSLYHSYVLQNVTNLKSFTAEDKINSLWGALQQGNRITMILRSLWTVVSVNFSIAVSILTSLSSLLFSGGTMLFNFVIFITTLFYLLIYSNQQYLPLHWISDVVRFDSSDKTNNFSRIIRSVFQAALRRTLFYGFYSWLVLSVFGQDVIFLPSVLAALAGTVPFIGPYWFSLPAILDLWLLDDRPLTALLVFLLFLFPSFVIDPLINSEIKGGHPYLTGLAILGGVYYTGLQGAIIGPILLCCFLYAIDFLSQTRSD